MERGPASSAPVSERLSLVRQEIALAAEAAGREPGDIELVAVTKTVAGMRSLTSVERMRSSASPMQASKVSAMRA